MDLDKQDEVQEGYFLWFYPWVLKASYRFLGFNQCSLGVTHIALDILMDDVELTG